MSSFSGKIKEFPQISVDRFDGRNLASTAYFLSHAHSDHMIGLSSPQFLDHLESNSGVYLYCSPITARFLQASIRHRPLDPYVRPLHLDEPVKINIPNVAEEATHHVWVTLIPAAHCPGSVMFLLEGRGGTVLYTGDFRIGVGGAARLRTLHNTDGTVKTLHSLHIDTTFCHRDVMQFPSREESAEAVGELIEDWLARGNNHLIHLVCPAKYGYEYIYRSIHERFNMKVHVNRWKYRMYDTVPEIQDTLTTNATETWIHACDWRANEVDEINKGGTRHLPCRCVPFGVDTEPSIRVIKTSAQFYAIYQSVKDLKQVNHDGSFCRVLLSMHASCAEVLDMVSYLRPRKVYPNVIPMNSTREEVLKLLHEALNRSGDHYSIEYGGSQRKSMGSFKRQLNSNDSSGSNTLETVMLDGFLTSPNKRRRHSDSNMSLILPTPRGNMKGSLSLEGEARCDPTSPNLPPPTDGAAEISSNAMYSENAANTSPLNLEWNDPYSNSMNSTPDKEFCLPKSSHDNGSAKCKNLNKNSASVKIDSDNVCSNDNNRNVIVKMNSPMIHRRSLSRTSSKQSNDGKSNLTCQMSVDEDLENSSIVSGLKTEMSQDSIELASVFSEDGDSASNVDVSDTRPASSAGVAGESSIKASRKKWYNHKYFSTPVHDIPVNISQNEVKAGFGPRSSSLPLPDCFVSPDIFSSQEGDSSLPLITVSSPSDQASDTQISDETNVTVILSSGDPSDVDSMLVDDLPQDHCTEPSQSILSHPLRPTVIRGPPTPISSPTRSRKSSITSPSSSTSSNLDSITESSKETKTTNTTNLNTNSNHLIDLVSDSDCTPDLEDLLMDNHDGFTIRSSCIKKL